MAETPVAGEGVRRRSTAGCEVEVPLEDRGDVPWVGYGGAEAGGGEVQGEDGGGGEVGEDLLEEGGGEAFEGGWEGGGGGGVVGVG